MDSDSLNRFAQEALSRYAIAPAATLCPLGNHGGFSGARLWRVETATGVYCLRLWPPDHSAHARLEHIHQRMIEARAAGLEFVPRLLLTSDRQSRLEQRGHWWELAEWRPGRPDFHANPTAGRLEAACVALAQLHRVWGRQRNATPRICPAVERRFLALRSWKELRTTGWDPLLLAKEDPLRPLIERAVTVLARWVPFLPEWLAPWKECRWSLQPCLCDVWHDHLLFEHDRLTGLVDYGAVKVDGVAVDVARLFGSLIEDDADAWRVGLAAYRSVMPLSADEEDLARVLDRTGTILGVANWLRWLYAEGRTFDNRRAVAQRLETLVVRIERWEVPSL